MRQFVMFLNFLSGSKAPVSVAFDATDESTAERLAMEWSDANGFGSVLVTHEI